MKSNKRQARCEGMPAAAKESATVRPRRPSLSGLKACGGVDVQVVHGFVNCNATGAITGIGNALPREVLQLVSLSKQAAKGDARARRLARELEAALAVLSSFDEGCDLVLYYKHLMVLNGDTEYSLHFNETDVLTDAQRNYAEQQYALFRSWYASWSAEQNIA